MECNILSRPNVWFSTKYLIASKGKKTMNKVSQRLEVQMNHSLTLAKFCMYSCLRACTYLVPRDGVRGMISTKDKECKWKR